MEVRVRGKNHKVTGYSDRWLDQLNSILMRFSQGAGTVGDDQMFVHLVQQMVPSLSREEAAGVQTYELAEIANCVAILIAMDRIQELKELLKQGDDSHEIEQRIKQLETSVLRVAPEKTRREILLMGSKELEAISPSQELVAEVAKAAIAPPSSNDDEIAALQRRIAALQGNG